MNIDTGQFAAIRDRADAAAALADRVASLEKRTDAITDHLRDDAMLVAAMRQPWDLPAARRAAPRRDRHGLRLVGGTGGSHAAGGAR